jgi:hypothetical protein
MWAGSLAPEGVRCSHHLARFPWCDPKTTPGWSGQTDEGTSRQSEDHGDGQRHAEVDGPSSQAPNRSVGGSELLTSQPKLIRFPSAHHQLVSSDERSASPGHRVAPLLRPVRAEARSIHEVAERVARVPDLVPKDMIVGWTLERPGSSSRVSTPASFRLRRFSRPWRFTPLRALRRVSVGHARGVVLRNDSTC